RRGDKSAARELWEERAALSTRHGFKSLLASASLLLGFALVEEGKGEVGIANMNGASAQLPTIHQRALSTGCRHFYVGAMPHGNCVTAKIDEFTRRRPGPLSVTS